MTIKLREQLHKTVDDLPTSRLETTLRFLELLANAPEDADVEPEETWLLANDTLKKMVDEIENAPPPVEDWRKHLNDL